MDNAVKTLAIVAAVAAAAVPTGAEALPRAAVTVGYAVSSAGGTSTPNADGSTTISQAGGEVETFAVSLRATPGEPRIVDAFTSRAYHRYNLNARDMDADDPVWRSHDALLAALAHNRPALTFILRPPARVEIRRSAALRLHDRCARSLIAASWAGMPPEENRRGRRRHALRSTLPDGRLPALFLRLVTLELPPASNMFWSEFERQRAANPVREEQPNQYRWRSEQIRLGGREVGLSVDLLRDRTSPAAKACLTIAPQDIGRRTRDRCTIDAMIDERDGWPIAIRVSRRTEIASGATAGTGTSFLRLGPLEGFVAPENPCSGGGGTSNANADGA